MKADGFAGLRSRPCIGAHSSSNAWHTSHSATAVNFRRIARSKTNRDFLSSATCFDLPDPLFRFLGIPIFQICGYKYGIR